MRTIDEARGFLEDTAADLVALNEMDPMEMYRRLVEIGRDLPPFPEDARTKENFVEGCVSEVYVAATLRDGAVYYQGASESQVVRGYVGVLVGAFSGLPADAIIDYTEPLAEEFAVRTDLRSVLTPNRANAFGSIYRLMRSKAAALRESA